MLKLSLNHTPTAVQWLELPPHSLHVLPLFVRVPFQIIQLPPSGIRSPADSESLMVCFSKLGCILSFV